MRRTSRARRLVAAGLAVPVIAWIYGSSIARGRAGRPVLVGGLVLASALGAVAVPEVRARPVPGPERLVPTEFLALGRQPTERDAELGASARVDEPFVLNLQALPVGPRVRIPAERVEPAADGQPDAAPQVAGAELATPAPSEPPAEVASGSGWRWPLIGPITQRFGESLTQYGVHQGLDINGETGDPVRAARSGRVIVAGHYDACGGLDVHIYHGDGFVSWYRHLSRVETRVGAPVRVGDVIGRVGNTGCSLGSHLHFGIQRRGVFVDPERYLPSRG